MAPAIPPRVAVVGATSLIGGAVLAALHTRKFAHAALHALEDERNMGRPVASDDPDSAAQRAPAVVPVAAFDFAAVDLVFFCGRAALAEQYAPSAAGHAWVIDCSAAFRGHHDVPLIVADVNGASLGKRGSGIIALPASASVALATALAPLHRAAGLVRADVATYQSVSGSGRAAMDELAGETVAMLSGKQARGRAFGRQIAFNVIPQVDAIDADGVTREERRLWEETRRVLGLPHLALNVTAVRVPVFFGHSFAVHAVFEQPITAQAAIAALGAAVGIAVIDPDSVQEYPTPATLATAPDQVYVGRVRVDPTRERALNMWVVADNVRKCAAHNAVSVAQILVNSAQ